ncbi:MAG: hypothetical protein M3R59_11605 [Verrucomicrobiota bacterium]|nr:hypothetical protein [Verrucomicrobiota bacterium]
MKTKTVGNRPVPKTPAEFHALGARLDREIEIVRPFIRKRGFVVEARTWNEMAEWENRRAAEEVNAVAAVYDRRPERDPRRS